MNIPDKTFRYELAGESFTGVFDLAPTEQFVLIGTFYAQEVTKPWHVRFDDVVVTTTP